MNRLSGWPALVLLPLLACGPAGEEETRADPDGVPQELVLALLGGQARESRLFVGVLPPATTPVVPVGPELRVVGGLLGDDDGTIILAVDRGGEVGLADYGEFVEGRGWTRAPDDPGGRGGFQWSERIAAGTWCSESHWMSVAGISVPGSEFLRARYHELEPGPTPCDHAEMRAQWGLGRMGLTFPQLEPPRGAEVRGGGGGGSSNDIDMDVVVVGDLTTEEVFEHYARQLTRAGWEPTASASGDGLAMGYWRAEDDVGAPAIGIFAVWALPEADTYRAWIRLERVRDD